MKGCWCEYGLNPVALLRLRQFGHSCWSGRRQQLVVSRLVLLFVSTWTVSKVLRPLLALRDHGLADGGITCRYPIQVEARAAALSKKIDQHGFVLLGKSVEELTKLAVSTALRHTHCRLMFDCCPYSSERIQPLPKHPTCYQNLWPSAAYAVIYLLIAFKQQDVAG